MKILHLYNKYFPDPPGGVAEAIKQLCYATNKQGVLNSIYCLSSEPSPNDLLIDNTRVFRDRRLFEFASCNFATPRALLRFREIASKHDVVHFHFPWPVGDVLYHLGASSKPLVVTYHSDIIKQKISEKFYHPLMRHTFRKATHIIATSQNYMDSSPILSHPAWKRKTSVIPLGIHDKPANKLADSKMLKRNYPNLEFPYALFLGVLRYYKGLEDLIFAASHVPFQIVIAGNGPSSDHLKSLCENYNVKNVIFLGQVSDEQKEALLRNCRVFVLPSNMRTEAFGVVLLEASMHAKPMITCQIGTGTSFVNLDGVTGFCVEANSPTQLGNAIRELMENLSLASQFGSASRARFEALFSIDDVAQRYVDVYRSSLGERC